MYEIEFYEDSDGYSEIAELIRTLRRKSVGEPVTKHLEGEIWELRPLKHRFLYAYFEHQKFIILHHFIKKTQKTPKREIEQAKKKLHAYKERSK